MTRLIMNLVFTRMIIYSDLDDDEFNYDEIEGDVY